MVPQDAVSWDFDVIMSALRDPAQRLPLLKDVEKWSSANVDAILKFAKQGRIEKAWTQMADALNQIARDRFQRTPSNFIVSNFGVCVTHFSVNQNMFVSPIMFTSFPIDAHNG